MPTDTLHRLAYLATADHDQANDFVRRALATNPGAERSELVTELMRLLQNELHRTAQESFDELDQILREDLTTSDQLTTRTRHDLLWELKRTCLVRTLGCISPSPRLAFILCDVYGATLDEAGAIFQVRPAAVRVRLTRARAVLRDYLEQRCVHFDPDNFCTCTGRLGIALRKDFISSDPVHPTPDNSHRGRRARSPSDLYAHLPIIQPPDFHLGLST